MTQHRDQVDLRQSIRTHLEGNQSLLDTQPADRFDFTFTPKHGSWSTSGSGFPRYVCVTSAWHQDTNLRIALWLASTTSIAIESSTLEEFYELAAAVAIPDERCPTLVAMLAASI